MRSSLAFNGPPHRNFDITPVETNIATLGGAICKEAEDVVREECESNIFAMPSKVNPAPLPATMGSRRRLKRKTEERDELWSQRPDWLPEGWTMNVKVWKDGATAGIRDRYYYEPRTSHRFRSRKEVEKFIQIGENSKPTPSSDMVLPPTLEFYSKH
ncbi:hypothetical protein MRB53_011013 [Persea americana]|uniref:Uncharacterized protein n=1 Tax=Persea americana TaxID=3435 RepID=A0ACC2LTB8_PERAE|nr:hypothetical protein MRB53_011013 [Persea americana]